MRKRMLLLLIVILLPSSLHARTVLYQEKPVIIKVAYAQPTEVLLDKEIASIVLGISTDDISLQNIKNGVYIQPLVKELSGDIYVITKDAETRILSLVSLDDPELRDKTVRIISSPKAEIERIKRIKEAKLTPAGLIKAMILGKDIDGVSVSQTRQVIIHEPVELVAHTVYDAVYVRGYIVDMTGHENFDIKKITMKGLIAGAMYNGQGYFVVQGWKR